ncbi:MAG: thiamine diphosphokinase [Culicoidibacterales bacterium]
MKIAMVTFWPKIAAIGDELKKYDYVFACEKAAIDLIRCGVALEAVVSDFDSVDEPLLTIKALEAVTAVTVLPKIKDETDTHALLMYILTNYTFEELVLYNSFDSRIDHALCLFSLFEKVGDLKIRTAQTLISRIEPGSHVIKWNEDFTYISFLALSPIENLSITKMKYEIETKRVSAFSDLLVSNEFLTPSLHGQISFSDGQILVIYAKDEKRCEQ